ncbi:Leucine-rich repeat serine/threonine-protein kinase 2-like [Oopsacas minuta]|uniref:Leucine-rich repeat serine/threonine-protein kinase 2-like n=1 Tax=Oopsacas minuta TaxID=111878 RepID=A0AAV7JL32_9METZ|nr:Leucine-rich repeat serine/threonine-protein kinase 2-like [Oopsacas minuta]
MKFLSALAELEVTNKHVVDCESIFQIIKILNGSGLNLKLQIYGYQSIAALISDEYCEKGSFTEKQENLISTLLKNVKHSKRVLPCKNLTVINCNIISVLALSDFRQRNKSISLMIPEVLGAMHLFSNVEMVQLASCAALLRFSKECSMTPNTEIMDLTFKTAQDFKQNFDLISIIMKIFNHNCEATLMNKLDRNVLKWISLIDSIMSEFNNFNSIQILGCEAIAHILTARPEAVNYIGIHTIDNEVPIHKAVVFAVMLYSAYLETLQMATTAVYCLAIYSEKIKDLLKDSGVFLAIMSAIKDHCDKLDTLNTDGYSELLKACLKRFKHLCEKYKDMIPHMHDCLVLQHLSTIIQKHDKIVDVLEEIFRFVSLMMESRLLCQDAINSNLQISIISIIMNNVSEFTRYQKVFNYGLDILIHIADHGFFSKLVKANCIEYIITILDYLKSCIQVDLVKKTFFLITLLSQEIIFTPNQTAKFCEIIFIYCELSNENEELLTEILACIQKLCELSSQIAQEFINQGLHSIIFNILMTSDQSSSKLVLSILELTSEILYTVSCVRDFKNQLLLKAIKDKINEGVFLLIDLGADVNYGIGNDTPLCIAVFNNSNEITNYLLAKGASDIQSAFKYACDLNRHEIVSTLVAHMSQNRETFGEIHMNGMNLESIRAQWFETLFNIRSIEFPRHLIHSNTKGSFSYVSTHFQLRKKYGDLLLCSSECEKSLDISEQRTSNSHFTLNDNSCRMSQNKSEDSAFMGNLHHHHPDLIKRSNEDKRGSITPIKDVMFNSLLPKDNSNIDIGGLCISSLGPFEHNRRYSKCGLENSISANCLDDMINKSNKQFLKYSIQKQQEPKLIMKNIKEYSDLYGNSQKYTREQKGNTLFQPISPTSLSISNKLSKNCFDPQPNGSSVNDSAIENPYYASDSDDSMNECYNTSSEELWGLRPQQPTDLRHSRFVQVMENLDESRETFGKNIQSSSKNKPPFKKFKDSNRHRKVLDYTLIKLILSNNRLPKFIFADLYHNKVQFYNNLSGLRLLDLHGNELSSLESEVFEKFTSLIDLNLSSNNFVQFPIESLLPQSLQHLNIMNNNLTSIPTLDGFSYLKILNVSNNRLELIPEYLGKNFPYLETLIISKNQILQLPELHCRFIFLKYLDVSDNKLVTIPPNFLFNCSNLESIIASNNQLESLPDDISVHMHMLEVVKMSRNDFSVGTEHGRIPKFITSLPKLRNLDMSSCGLLNCPSPRQWDSRKLKDLILSNNQITFFHLHEDCCQFWPLIERINLSHNKLKNIPKEIGLLTSLKLLDISHNASVAKVPLEVGKLYNLFALNLSGLNNLEVTLRGRKTRAILKYFQARIHNSVSRNRAQIFFLGPSSKVKQKIFLNFCSPKNSPDKVVSSNIVIREWRYSHNLNEAMVIQIWNFTNNLRYLSTYQTFFTERTLYLIPYDIIDGSEFALKIQPWILAIHSAAPRALCLLVGICTGLNKCCIHQAASVYSTIREMLELPGYPESVKTMNMCLHEYHLDTSTFKANVLELLETTSIRGDKLLGNMIPENYAALENILFKERIRLMENDFPVLTHNQILTIISASRLNNKFTKDEVEQVMIFLNQNNTVYIYSSAFTIPEKLYVFNPNWILSLTDKIFDLPCPNPYLNKNAILHEMCIEYLFRPPAFPVMYIHVYMKLLEIVNFVIPTTQNEVFIPLGLTILKPVKKLPFLCLSTLITRRIRMAYTPITFWGHFLSQIIVHTNILDLRPQVEVWQKGIYFLWNQDTFLIVETLVSQENCFDIIVCRNKQGYILLGEIVDHLDVLIDERFPELKDINVRNGSQKIQFSVPCPLCVADNNEYSIHECLEAWKLNNFIICPKTDKSILLDYLIPDLQFLDLDHELQIKSSDLEIDFQNPAALLGRGGFGEVYKAVYRSRTIALKLFSATIDEITPHHMLRREFNILKKLKHPNVIGIIGISVDIDVKLLIEYAKYGSLSRFQQEPSITPLVKHSISMQILSALSYIHSKNIIYRDLKPDNVMVFSLSQNSIHVKLIDFGIACVVTKAGLYADIGTSGYKSPEMLRVRYSKESYTESTDIYSFGMLVYGLFTNGHQPFEDLLYVNEIDRAIEEGKPIEDLLHYGYDSWPDLQDLIDNCLQYYPTVRPTAKQLYEKFHEADFLSLKRSVAICQFSKQEVLTTRYFINDIGEDANELWIVSQVENESQLAVLNVSNMTSKLQGKYLGCDVTILSITSVGSHSILMGSCDGIRVYDGSTQCFKHVLRFLHHAVLCFASSTSDTKRLFAGTTGGEIAQINGHAINSNKDNYLINIVKISTDPIQQIQISKQRLWICSNKTIYVMKPSDLSLERTWDISTQYRIGGFIIVNNSLWTFELKSSKIEIWDIRKPVKRGTIDISSFMIGIRADTTFLLMITSMFYNKQDSVWIGTNIGYLYIIDQSSQKPILCTQRYASNISNIMTLPFGRYSLGDNRYILTTGKGFYSKFSTSDFVNINAEYSYLLVWDPQIARIQREITYSTKKNRISYMENHEFI